MNRIKHKALSILVFLSAMLLVAAPAFASTALEGSFKTMPAIILGSCILLFLVVGFMNKAESAADYYAAGRSISRVGSGMAIASNWMSAASFLGMAGLPIDLVPEFPVEEMQARSSWAGFSQMVLSSKTFPSELWWI